MIQRCGSCPRSSYIRITKVQLCTPRWNLPDSLSDSLKSVQFFLSQNRLHNSVECCLPLVNSKIRAELPDGAWCHLKVPSRLKVLFAIGPGLCIFSFFFNIYCSIKNRNTCLCQSSHGISDEKTLKENNKMQFESKHVKLPRHPQLKPLESSWEDADRPSVRSAPGRASAVILHLPDFSLLSVFHTLFPHPSVCPMLKEAWKMPSRKQSSYSLLKGFGSGLSFSEKSKTMTGPHDWK